MICDGGCGRGCYCFLSSVSLLDTTNVVFSSSFVVFVVNSNSVSYSFVRLNRLIFVFEFLSHDNYELLATCSFCITFYIILHDFPLRLHVNYVRSQPLHWQPSTHTPNPFLVQVNVVQWMMKRVKSNEMENLLFVN